MVKKNYPRNLSQWESEMETFNKLTVTRRCTNIWGKIWDWLIGVGRWVVAHGSCALLRGSWVVRDNRSCFVDSGFSRRLLLVEFKGTVFLYTSLHIYEKVCSVKSSGANLSAKYVLSGSLPFSRNCSSHTLCVLNEMHKRPRKPLPVKKKFFDTNNGFCFKFQYFFLLLN